MTNLRIGQGYDVHRLKEGRALILGGVDIPYEKGLDGHSDADVLVHAVMDALLGAAKLGDIGKLFPDTDPRYADISSLKLLLGYFENEEFGTYSRYTYHNPDGCIVVTAKGETLVFSGENAHQTKEIYNTLLDKMK